MKNLTILGRRNFLVASSGALVTLGLPVKALAAIQSNNSGADGLDPQLEAECRVCKDGQTVAQIKLVGLDTPHPLETKVAQYILNFEATNPVNLPEANYEVTHPILGQLDLFLQPCGMFIRGQHNGKQYRACMAMLR